jgi:hypothetical protein
MGRQLITYPKKGSLNSQELLKIQLYPCTAVESQVGTFGKCSQPNISQVFSGLYRNIL